MGTHGEKLLAVQDATITTSYAQLTATALRLSSVWIEYFKEKEAPFSKQNFPVAIILIGYSMKITTKEKLKNEKYF